MNMSQAGWHRRDVLQVGSLGISASLLGGLGLESVAARPGAGTGKAESVIFLWIGGGMTHIDSFDPKPEAPEEIRGELTAISTRLPGVQFSETLPQLAQVADQLSVVRSYSHDSNDHLLSQVYTLSGRKVTRNQLFSEPNIGAIVSYLYGSRNGLPGYIAVPGITRPGPPPPSPASPTASGMRLAGTVPTPNTRHSTRSRLTTSETWKSRGGGRRYRDLSLSSTTAFVRVHSRHHPSWPVGSCM